MFGNATGPSDGERPKGIDRKGHDVKVWLGKEKKQNGVRFLFVQLGVVSTCNVTERISFVNSFCSSFQEGRFGVRLGFLLEHFLRHVSKGMWERGEEGVPRSARCLVRLWIRVHSLVYGSCWNNFTRLLHEGGHRIVKSILFRLSKAWFYSTRWCFQRS